ncbi:MAG: hypothetical protein HY748_16710 [Elusimicrobia bacterium]|nr:hypothetical protein [Elusimicrobiota bacterium]
MELYGRFMVTLAFGLLGLGIVLQVLLDQVFNDWDVVADAHAGIKRLMRGGLLSHRRTEDVLLDIEDDKPKELSTRLSNTAPRRTLEVKAAAPENETSSPALTPLIIKAGSYTARNPVYDEEWG